MRQFDSPVKNTLYLFYRCISPVVDPVSFYQSIKGYPRFIKDFILYKNKNSRFSMHLRDLYPILNETSSYTPFDAHYYYQGIWLLKQIIKRKPSKHIDVGSTYALSGYISLITKSEFVDLRPIDTHLENLTIRRGDILHLPYKSGSVTSISSLHVIEHIGLGRYGDSINPFGSELACRELVRVLKPNGFLYISVPIGKQRICFNAHKIFDPETIIQYCKGLRLIQFSAVNDNGIYKTNVQPKQYKKATYACGFYVFEKQKI